MIIRIRLTLLVLVLLFQNVKCIDTHSTAVLLQQKCRNTVVKVITNELSYDWLEPYKSSSEGDTSTGSGFFIDSEGCFLTNFHVIEEQVRVQFQMAAFGQDKMDCHVVGVCPARDLALLKIDDTAKDKIIAKFGTLEFLQLGDSDSVSRGDEVTVLGFPLGRDIIKGTEGIVSGWDERRLSGCEGPFSCIEMTAAINGGNSGGPVLNKQGKVLGIAFAVGLTRQGGVQQVAQNVGYVLPISELKSTIKQLYKHKLLLKPELGASMQPTVTTFGKCLGCPDDGGIYVQAVCPASIAEQVGILAGDVIYKVNGYVLDHHGAVIVPWREDKVFFSNLWQRLEDGDYAEIVLYRQQECKVLNFRFDGASAAFKIRKYYPLFEEIDYEIVGGLVIMELTLNHLWLLSEINPNLSKYFLPENRNKSVLVVTSVQGTSEAYRNEGGVSKGSILEKICGVPVSNLGELRRELVHGLDQEFITVSGDDQSLTVLETEKLLIDELRLAQLFKYQSDHSVVLAKLLANYAGSKA